MLGLKPELNAALVRNGFSEPTPIQNQAIPLALQGHDILGLAQTGTGKTLAFGLPLMEYLLQNPGKPRPRHVKALVLAPTRELVNQIAESLRALTDPKMKIKVGTVMGGQSIRAQIAFMARGVDVLVATPGRLIDLMDRGAVDLDDTRHLVLDEADQMLDLGFIHALRKIAPKLGTPRQTMLFSATMPKQMEELAQAYLTNPRRIQVAPPGKPVDKIDQSVHFLSRADKPDMLRDILSADIGERALVFARTKYGAEKLMKSLVFDGYNAASIHGNKTQGQRDRAIKDFRAGDVTVLVATDVAARGIDIPDVRYVINYDLPDAAANYVHRIGRTARAGKSGEAIALCSPEEVGLLRDVEKLMKLEIPTASGERPEGPAPARPPRGRGRPGHSPKGRGPKGRNGPPKGQGKPRHKSQPGKPSRSRRRRPSAAA